MTDVKVRYLGEKKRKRVKLPVPFVSLSDDQGEVTFAGPGDVQMVPAKDADVLVREFPDQYELVQAVAQEKKSEKPSKSAGVDSAQSAQKE